MANIPSQYESRVAVAGSAVDRSYGIAEAHVCPACGTTTLALSGVLRSAQNGQLPVQLRGAIPDTETVSRWLRPPDVPNQAGPVRRDIWGKPFSTAILVFVVILAAAMFYAIGGYLLAIPLAILGMLFGLTWIRKSYPRPQGSHSSVEHERALALRAWDRRMEVWERLGVCPNCGMLSDPQTGRTAEWYSVPSLFV